MIIYFSACGNSKQASEMLAQKIGDERVVNIAKAFKNNEFEYRLEDGESLGFVFPVYFWGVPSVVLDFIKQLKIENLKDNYVYTAMTCGSSTGLAGKMLKKALKKRGIALNAEYGIVMPDTYVVMFPVNEKSEAIEILDKAETYIDKVASSIKEKKTGKTNEYKGGIKQFITYITYPLYNKVYRKTKRFKVSDSCIGCGICAKICPVSAIEMKPEASDSEKNRPTWVLDKCVHCLACIHRCPQNSIANGMSSTNGQYINPRVKLDN